MTEKIIHNHYGEKTSCNECKNKEINFKYKRSKSCKKCCGNSNIPSAVKKNLVSNIPKLAPVTDKNLVDPVGLIKIGDKLFVSNNNSSKITSYSLEGTKSPDVVSVIDTNDKPLHPNGLTANETLDGFVIHKGLLAVPALWLTVTEEGTINAYNPIIEPDKAQIVINSSSTATVYKDVIILNDHLYATDFANGKVDVFDKNFNNVTTSYKFIDNDTSDPLPVDYSPLGINNIDGLIWLTYGKKSTNNKIIFGNGNGYVNIFDKNGIFIKRFASAGQLNAPYSIVQENTSLLENQKTIKEYLIDNIGDGFINVFNNKGVFLDKLTNLSGKYIHLNSPKKLLADQQDDVNCGSTCGILASNVIYFTERSGSSEKTGVLGELVITPGWSSLNLE